MRKIPLINGEYYHIFGRGVDKRTIFIDRFDYARFMVGMEEFNVLDPIGSLFENSFSRRERQFGHGVSKPKPFDRRKEKLVDFVCYCLNPNHYHFLLKQLVDKGVEKFMHRLCMGYAKYFNIKYRRSGALFQGPFKAVHIDANEYLLHLSAYVNLNNRVHRLGHGVSKSSWDEYIKGKNGLCRNGKEIILSQFRTAAEYKDFTDEALKIAQERKDMESLLLED